MEAEFVEEFGDKSSIRTLKNYQEIYVEDIMKLFMFMDDQLKLIYSHFNTMALP